MPLFFHNPRSFLASLIEGSDVTSRLESSVNNRLIGCSLACVGEASRTQADQGCCGTFRRLISTSIIGLKYETSQVSFFILLFIFLFFLRATRQISGLGASEGTGYRLQVQACSLHNTDGGHSKIPQFRYA